MEKEKAPKEQLSLCSLGLHLYSLIHYKSHISTNIPYTNHSPSPNAFIAAALSFLKKYCFPLQPWEALQSTSHTHTGHCWAVYLINTTAGAHRMAFSQSHSSAFSHRTERAESHCWTSLFFGQSISGFIRSGQTLFLSTVRVHSAGFLIFL